MHISNVKILNIKVNVGDGVHYDGCVHNIMYVVFRQHACGFPVLLALEIVVQAMARFVMVFCYAGDEMVSEVVENKVGHLLEVMPFSLDDDAQSNHWRR